MAASKPTQPQLVSATSGRFSGHKTSITCLAVNSTDSLLASGSEVRLFHDSIIHCMMLTAFENLLTFLSTFLGQYGSNLGSRF